MFEYSIDKKLELGLAKAPLKRSQYDAVIGKETVYGEPTIKPELSVVIVAYNEGNDLIEAIYKVFAQKTSNKFDVILVDNGLDKTTQDKLKEFSLKHIIMRENIGCSAGRNVGSLFANAPILGFVDADGFVNENFINESLRAISKYPTAVRGKVIPKTAKSQTPPSYNLGNNDFQYYINAEGISIWNKKQFINSGGFEDVLYGGEGIVLQNRMIEIYDIDPKSFGYDPRIILMHDYHNNPEHFKDKQTRYEIITRKIHAKYPFLPSMISFYNRQVTNLIPKPTSTQNKVSSQIENIRLNVGTKFGSYYRQQHQERMNNPSLVNGKADKPNFSVIIPCYNVGDKLYDAIDSVLKQTIESIEIIVLDDASTDLKTHEVLNDIERKVKLIRKDVNKGVASARNTGIKAARAPYVLCLDGDDTIAMNYLEEAYNVFESSSKVGLVSCWVQLVGARSGQWRPDDKISIPEALLASPVPTATCFRKEAWKKVGGYNESMRGYEDWNFWISVMREDYITRVLPKPHFNYTISPTSKVHTSNKNALELVGTIYDNHKDLFKKHLRYIITNKYRDYVILRSEYIDYRMTHGDTNSLGNLFRFERYPNYAKRAFKKGKSFIQIARDSKDPVYVSKLLFSKLNIYRKALTRKLGF